jgi:hypothetical protein
LNIVFGVFKQRNQSGETSINKLFTPAKTTALLMNGFFNTMVNYVLYAWHPAFTVVNPTQPNELSRSVNLKRPSPLQTFFQRSTLAISYLNNNSFYQSTTTVYASFKNYKCHCRDTHVFD